jgi:hypothetical protein
MSDRRREEFCEELYPETSNQYMIIKETYYLELKVWEQSMLLIWKSIVIEVMGLLLT